MNKFLPLIAILFTLFFHQISLAQLEIRIVSDDGCLEDSEIILKKGNSDSINPTSTECEDIDLSNSYFSTTYDGLELNTDYTVSINNNNNPSAGVSTYDLILINKHILGTLELDSPYKIIAADVNNTSSITASDLVFIRQLILGKATKFETNTSWRFINANFGFESLSNPWFKPIPESSMTIKYQGDTSLVYRAIKIGDVNEDVFRNITNEKSIQLVVDDQELDATETYTIDFRVQDFKDMLGCQFSLQFDTTALDFINLQAPNLIRFDESNIGLGQTEEGIINLSWSPISSFSLPDDESIFSFSFKSKKQTQLSETISLNSQLLSPEAYDSDLEILALELNFENQTVATEQTLANDQFSLSANTPNPFEQETQINFHLPNKGQAAISIFDVNGKLIKEIKQTFLKGENQVLIQKNDLAHTGVYFYQLSFEGNQLTGKMMLVE